MTQSLTSKTIHGLKWNYTAMIINSIMQIGYSAVMARLLEPAAFGLIAMAGVVLRFGQYFAQMGVGSALIQKKELTENEIMAGFTSSLFLGVFFTLITWFIAPLSLYIFNSAELIPVVRMLGFSFLMGGLSIISMSLLRRKMNFKATAIGEMISYILGYAGVGIVMAWQGFGVWSLVGAALSQKAISALICYSFERHSLKLVFKWEYYQPLYAFGGKVSIIGFLEFIVGSMPTFYIGRWMGSGLLGLFNRGYYIINLPLQYFTGSLSRVLFPSFSQIQEDRKKIKKIYLTSTQLLSLFLFPVSIAVSISANEIVLVLLGEKWVQAIPVLQILALFAPFCLLAYLDAVVCEAIAILNARVIFLIFHIIFLAGLMWYLKKHGIVGISYAFLTAEFFRYIFYKIILQKALNLSIKELFTIFGQSLFVSSLFFSVSFGLVNLSKVFEPSLLVMVFINLFVTLLAFITVIYFYPNAKLRTEVKNKTIHPLMTLIRNRANKIYISQ